MILCIDIGNTNITLGGFADKEPSFVARISSDSSKTADEYASLLLSTLSLYGVDRGEIDGAIIASVVPPLTSVMKNAVRFVYGTEAFIVGKGLKTGINIHCDNPASVGADLICACVAAHRLYGSPALIADLGTATKIMALDKSGTFIGVSILPGVKMGLSALSNGTAQLPQVDLEAPSSVIGKNTADCMKSGAVFGNAAAIDGMIDRFRDAMGEPIPVYATGGLAPLIVGYCRHPITLDEHMVLKGLYLVYLKNAEAA